MAGATLEGSLLITLKGSGRGERTVAIQSSRPLQTPRIFNGKGVDEVTRMLPLLYSVCGTAQGYAAATACEQAIGMAADGNIRAARELLVWFETAREHLWRITMDWSGFLGRPAEAAVVTAVMGLFSEFRQTLFPEGDPFAVGQQLVGIDRDRLDRLIRQLEQLLEQAIYQQPVAAWLEIPDEAALLSWMGSCDSVAARQLQQLVSLGWCGIGSARSTPLPELTANDLESRLGGEGVEAYNAAPTDQGHCCETSPFTRVGQHPLMEQLTAAYGSGLLPRMTARLVELAGIPARLRAGAAGLDGPDQPPPAIPAESGSAVAQVEAARGRLIHRVAITDRRVSDYRILAPTEWNFHPNGVLANALLTLEATSDEVLSQQAGWLINAIDPCVGFTLEVE